MTYKRQYRELPDATKQKIQASTKGKRKSAEHKMHISQAMRDYWSRVPNKPTQEHVTMQDLTGANNTTCQGGGFGFLRRENNDEDN